MKQEGSKNIWDLAIAQSQQKRAAVTGSAGENQNPSDNKQTKERSLLLIGSKGVGKTTLFHRLLESQDSAKPTLALEYTFGRKTNVLAKDVCHIWELGGGTLFTKLLETPFSPTKVATLHVVIMVDLSKPDELWFTLETLMFALQNHLEQSTKRNEEVEKKVRKVADSIRDEKHPDLEALKPFPLPLLILGGRYDDFQNFEPEKKKIICRALRFFAHFHGASLQFYSAMDTGLVKKARDILNFHAFGTEPGRGMSQDYNKPLIIPAWSDSMSAIMGQDASARISLDMWKHQYTTHFPQTVSEQNALPDDPARDRNYREDRIDKLRAQKDEELERYRRVIERKSTREWDADFDQSVK